MSEKIFDISTVSGLVFDCDGTLLDTLDAWDAAEADLFAQIPFKLTREQEDEIHGAPIAEAAHIFHERYGVMESPEAVLAHLDAALLSFYGEVAQPLPGVVEFVSFAAGRGIPCVVVSSSPRRYLEAGLRRAGILQCMKELISTEEVGCSKSEPLIYETALRALGSARETTWAIDDAFYARHAMQDFGFKTIAPTVGMLREGDKQEVRFADVVVYSLDELLP